MPVGFEHPPQTTSSCLCRPKTNAVDAFNCERCAAPRRFACEHQHVPQLPLYVLVRTETNWLCARKMSPDMSSIVWNDKNRDRLCAHTHMSAVGFEPTSVRTGAWSQRLRPLGKIVFVHMCTEQWLAFIAPAPFSRFLYKSNARAEWRRG